MKQQGWLSGRLWDSPWTWACLLLLVFAVVRLLSGYDGLYGQDSYAYYNYARAIQSHWRTGNGLGHFLWPRLYPFMGALWFWGDPKPWMQFLSMAGSALALAMTIQWMRAAQPGARWTGPLAFLCIGLAPFLLRQSLSILSDSVGLGFMAWALWQGTCYASTGNRWQLAAAALLTGLAVWTRYPVALLLCIPCLGWLLAAWRGRDFWGIALFLPVLLLAAIPQYLLLPQNSTDGLDHAFQNPNFIQWSPLHAFQREFGQIDGVQRFSTPNIVASFGIFWHPRYLGIGLLGVVAWLFYKRLALPRGEWGALLPILGYGLFLAGIPFQNSRFQVLMLPFAAKFLGGGWEALAQRLPQGRGLKILAFGLALALQLGLGLYACRLVLAENQLERRIAADLHAVPRQDRRLYEFSLEAMLVGRDVGFEKVSLWEARIPMPRRGDMAIFNEAAFATQFAGLPPMEHWEAIRALYSLDLIKAWEGGWHLYELR